MPAFSIGKAPKGRKIKLSLLGKPEKTTPLTTPGPGSYRFVALSKFVIPTWR